MSKIAEMQEEYDFSAARRGPVAVPESGKTRIALRLNDEIIDWFRQQVEAAGGGSYQALMNDALKDHIRNRALEDTLRRVIREELKPSVPA